jgi:hypothetical protein
LGDPPYFVELHIVLALVVEVRCARRLVRGDLLRNFQLAAVLEVRRDASCTKCMISNFGFVSSVAMTLPVIVNDNVLYHSWSTGLWQDWRHSLESSPQSAHGNLTASGLVAALKEWSTDGP